MGICHRMTNGRADESARYRLSRPRERRAVGFAAWVWIKRRMKKFKNNEAVVYPYMREHSTRALPQTYRHLCWYGRGRYPFPSAEAVRTNQFEPRRVAAHGQRQRHRQRSQPVADAVQRCHRRRCREPVPRSAASAVRVGGQRERRRTVGGGNSLIPLRYPASPSSPHCHPPRFCSPPVRVSPDPAGSNTRLQPPRHHPSESPTAALLGSEGGRRRRREGWGRSC